jgi:hypothetical protein
MLAKDELEKGVIGANVNATNAGTCILTNPAWKGLQKQKALAALEKSRADVDRQRLKTIKKAAKIAKDKADIEALIVVAAADIRKGKFDDAKEAEWQK